MIHNVSQRIKNISTSSESHHAVGNIVVDIVYVDEMLKWGLHHGTYYCLGTLTFFSHLKTIINLED